ncbi:MAG: TIGR04282 family arsenosugar biosynthesis glycosyltransferase [Candidatus Dormibacteraceae bacterium]
MNRLYFAAKAPLAGEAKTRLGACIGMTAAATLYSAFLLDLAERFASASFQTGWSIAPGAMQHLLPFIGSSAEVLTQRGDTWAERQTNLFKRCAAGREDRIVLAATDSPQLTTRRVEQAFQRLDACDVVLGPTHDGGYYLVGMRGFHDILQGVEMSTDSALSQVLERARAQQVTAFLLDPEFDVDTENDLIRLADEVGRRDDLANTAAALAALRSPAPESRIA